MAENEMFICLVLCMSSDAFNGQSNSHHHDFLRTNSFSTRRLIQSWQKHDSVHLFTIITKHIKDVNNL